MTTMYPNARNNPAGAMPVYTVAGPPGMPITLGVAPATPDAGPIPVRFVTAPSGPGGSDQGLDANAIPVFISSSPKAMPVWDVGAGAPLPPQPNPVTFTNAFEGFTTPRVLGTCTCTNGPATWSLIDSGGLSLNIAAGSGQLVIMSMAGVSVGTFHAAVQASNADGIGQGVVTIEFT